jgi:hypothetical protein
VTRLYLKDENDNEILDSETEDEGQEDEEEEVVDEPAEVGYASVDELLAYEDMDSADVVIKAWGGKRIQLRPLTMGEVRRFQKLIKGTSAGASDEYYKATLVATCLQPLFTKAQVDAIWVNKSAQAIGEIIKGIDRVNGFGNVEEKEARAKADEDTFQD